MVKMKVPEEPNEVLQRTVKGKKRIEIIEMIANACAESQYFKFAKYENKSESEIKEHLYNTIVRNLNDNYYNNKLEDVFPVVQFEADKRDTVNNKVFFGVGHRPDMIYKDDFTVAIEIKKGDVGSDIRAGLGQALVYSSVYDFVLYFFIDTTTDKKIKKSLSDSSNEAVLRWQLWDWHNIWFLVF